MSLVTTKIDVHSADVCMSYFLFLSFSLKIDAIYMQANLTYTPFQLNHFTIIFNIHIRNFYYYLIIGSKFFSATHAKFWQSICFKANGLML
jgi:hypothetical protein